MSDTWPDAPDELDTASLDEPDEDRPVDPSASQRRRQPSLDDIEVPEADAWEQSLTVADGDDHDR